jgi:hypothetical protein
MAEKIVSPGVFTRENDLSFLTQGVGEIGAAIIGPFHKGPAFVPTVVNTQSEFESIFGTPDGTYYTGYTVRNYLREAGTVTIVRVGHTGGYNHVKPVAITVDGDTIIGTLHSTTTTNEEVGFYDTTTISATAGETDFVISGSVLGTNISASILPSANNDISDVFGQSPMGTKNAYTYTYFEKTATDYNGAMGSSTISLLEIADQDFSNDVQHSSTPWIKSQLISDERYDLFRFHSIGDGTIYNREYKVSIFNVKPAGTSNATDYSVFSIAVRGFSDIDKRPVVLETYNNVTLDPASPNYLPRIIGDRNLVIDANGKQTENGDYPNRSKYIRVEVKAEGSFPVTAGPFGHGAYINPIYVGGGNESYVPAAIYTTGSAENNSSSAVKFSGLDFETSIVKEHNHNYLAPIPVNATTGGNTDFSFDGDINALIGGSVSTVNLNFELTGSDGDDIAKRQFTVGFQEGFDGISPTIKPLKAGENGWGAGNSQGFDLSTSTASGSVAYVRAINSVSNPDDFDINLVSTPGVVRHYHTYVFDKVVDMVETRQDAFYIGDVVGVEYNSLTGRPEMQSISLAVTQANALDTNYVGTYYPWVKTIDTTTGRLISVPPSVLMPGIYAANDAIAAEWYAPAGLNRGGIVGAVSVLNRLTHAERDTLYDNKINPIASFPGEGIVAFGQKTLQTKPSALDRINVRRLLIKVKKFFASTSRYLVFEQNTSTTRQTFLNTVTPYLEAIQQRQGLYAFRVVMDESNNTPDVIDRNILTGQIYLQPTKTAEFIILDFNILPTGASFNV